MVDKLSHLISKAWAFQDAMASLPKKELSLMITGGFALEYNRLRDVVHDAMPTIEEHLPPVVYVGKADKSGNVCQTRYVELLAYCMTLTSLLDTEKYERQQAERSEEGDNW